MKKFYPTLNDSEDVKKTCLAPSKAKAKSNSLLHILFESNTASSDSQNHNKSITPDSYEAFLTHFNISRKDFFDWGISATIFPPVDKVAIEWEQLKQRISQNQMVYIRGYGRDAQGTKLYKDLYSYLFDNTNIEKDPTNNATPQKLIQQLTGLKRNKDIYNYQVSHIWGHTKNLYMFECPWNVCYTPKIMDPFTGHETKGSWPIEYQKLFLEKAYHLYRPFIEDYNSLLLSSKLQQRIEYYLNNIKGTIPKKSFNQFSIDVFKEFEPIDKP